MQRVPLIIGQGDRFVEYAVPSKSNPGTNQLTTKREGMRDCSCEGVEWFRRKGQLEKFCRHQKMTTMRMNILDDTTVLLDMAISIIRDRSKAPYVAFAQLRCQFPDHFNGLEVHCRGCPIYPDICNIHKIKIDHRGRLPLVWKLQGAIYHGRRKDAEKLLLRIRKEVRRLK